MNEIPLSVDDQENTDPMNLIPRSTGLLLLFMSQLGIWVMERSETIYIDGTFETCPNQFSQLYFIMAQMPNRRAILVAFCLLPNKEKKTYKVLWQKIMEIVHFVPGSPKRFILDFEMAMLKTLTNGFINVPVSGCFFHFRQCLRRNLGFKGCLKLYNQSKTFQFVVKIVYGLAFVRVSSICEAFYDVIEVYLTDKKAGIAGFEVN